MNPYKPKKISSCLDFVFICILAWVLVLVALILVPEIVIGLVR
ncbi:MAG: hypothetical protein KatS3mg054_0628 [Chloroflexus sp.]|nr:MAG: hypothetical protein KatS3mg054_0628 [Chloroflexus sp.]